VSACEPRGIVARLALVAAHLSHPPRALVGMVGLAPRRAAPVTRGCSAARS
jgi:hypothetical protein